jgi:hypothetical protein
MSVFDPSDAPPIPPPDFVPRVYWRLPDGFPLVERVRTSVIAGHASARDFDARWPGNGPAYVALFDFTCWNTYWDPSPSSPQRRAFEHLTAAYPGRWQVVHADDHVWLARPVNQLTDELVAILTELRRRTMREIRTVRSAPTGVHAKGGTT